VFFLKACSSAKAFIIVILFISNQVQGGVQQHGCFICVHMPCFSQMSLNRPLLLARAQFHKVISQLRFFRATKQNIKSISENTVHKVQNLRSELSKHRQYAVLMILRGKKVTEREMMN